MNHRPKKSLGQNFLKNPGIIEKIAGAAHLQSDDLVLEIGPGLGALTEKLIPQAGVVVAVEKDDSLISVLQEKFASETEQEKFHIINGDVLDFDPESLRAYINKSLKQDTYKLVANIPYYITGAIIEKFLSEKFQPSMMVLLVQKEVAERIVAKDKKTGGAGKESILSIAVKAYGEPHYIGTVRAGSFVPAPSIDSAIIAIENISRVHFKNAHHEQVFFQVMKAGFAHKRKTLAGNLKNIFEPEMVDEVMRAGGGGPPPPPAPKTWGLMSGARWLHLCIMHSMNPQVPSQYQNSFSKYLPSKKIWIMIIVIVLGVGTYGIVPKIIAYYHARKNPAVPPSTVSVVSVNPTGNPTTRDTLNDGIPDWEKIAVGLNPSDPKSTAAFTKLSQAAGADTMAQVASTNDTNKVAYTLFNNLVNVSNQNGTLDDATVASQTNQELTNYVVALAPADVYTDASLQSVPDTVENQQAYKKSIQTLGPVDLFNTSFQATLADYLANGNSSKSVTSMMASIQVLVAKMQTIPTPQGILDYQVGNINALNNFAKIVNSYDTTNKDPLYQYANMSLLQMYEASLVSNSASILTYYKDPKAAIFEKVIQAQQP